MKNIEFRKRCEPTKLHKELVNAGFDIHGVSTIEPGITIVHLKDTEEKDPTSIVEDHVYEEPIILRPISIEKVVQKLIEKGIITSRSEVEI